MKGTGSHPLLILVLLGSACTHQPAVPWGYHLGRAVVLPDSLYEAIGQGRAVVTISRPTGDSVARRLLGIAERIYVDRAAFPAQGAPTDTTRALNPSVDSMYRAIEAISGADRWWWNWTSGSMPLPFSVTGQTVTYYMEYARTMADAPRRPAWGGLGTLLPVDSVRPDSVGPTLTFSMGYRATVTPDVRPGEYLVTMTLSLDGFSATVGGVRHTRVVRMTRDGAVLDISGDKPPSYVVL